MLLSTNKWCDVKYSKFFIPSLMSDDEDKLDEKGGRTGWFVSRVPTYHVEEVRALFCYGLYSDK